MVTMRVKDMISTACLITFIASDALHRQRGMEHGWLWGLCLVAVLAGLGSICWLIHKEQFDKLAMTLGGISVLLSSVVFVIT